MNSEQHTEADAETCDDCAYDGERVVRQCEACRAFCERAMAFMGLDDAKAVSS